ncbi:MAG: ATP-binding protein [candidate division KSB1 bacterium]|nr:ATP-binding protein [candidate division KSB1 bacterium]
MDQEQRAEIQEGEHEISYWKQQIPKLQREVDRLSQKLEAKNQELRQYLYLVSHELKTPIISMRGFSSLLSEYHAGNLGKEGREYLERITKNLDQMERLVDDLLEFSKIEISEEEFEEVNISQLLEEALVELQFLLEKEQIHLIIAQGLPTIYCHRSLMVRVFTNLINNSIKYSKTSQRPEIEIGYCGEEIFHKFFDRDNGVGISPRDRDKLFQMFARLGNKKGVEGTGLGLAIVKRIIEGHGGEIWVDSQKGKGATFFFTLPKRRSGKLASNSDQWSGPVSRTL